MLNKRVTVTIHDEFVRNLIQSCPKTVSGKALSNLITRFILSEVGLEYIKEYSTNSEFRDLTLSDVLQHKKTIGINDAAYQIVRAGRTNNQLQEKEKIKKSAIFHVDRKDNESEIVPIENVSDQKKDGSLDFSQLDAVDLMTSLSNNL